jgi:ABC-type nitrate/sulfonate/bicarbonate transport system ATPase subunit
MRRRVAVVQALVSGRKLVVLDEPMAELDLGARKAIEMAIGEVANEGRACLFASHEIDSVAAVATQVVVLEGERPAKAVLHDLSVDFPPGLSALERRSHPRFTDVVARLQREAWR